jgi:AdoMet-dependent rRNA methyltransferase SPB1
VASKYMPPSSIIVGACYIFAFELLPICFEILGVDLVPIKPIPRVITFAADITTPACRNLIRGELKDWKADVVLHDGAPNVGTAWVQDAFSQSELVLMSLKLAVEFLMKGGTFVTKIFRSADYNNLMWVFNQLFAKVEATKPPASR